MNELNSTDSQADSRNNTNLGKNTVLNTIKTVFSIIFPLITFPYVSRILGVENVGKINYGNSIVSYFSLIAGLGISTYAIRECSKVRDDNDKLSDTASQIISINILSTVISYVALFITLSFASKLDPYRELIIIQSTVIVFTTLGADWLNPAMEDFKYITIRTISAQFVSLLLMFIFVRHTEDYITFAIISVLASSGANVVNIIYRRRFCRMRFTIQIDWKRHLPHILLLFSMLLSQTIYTSSDTTMLGLMKSDYQVGLYSTSVKIYNMVNQVVASIAYVLMPGLSKCFAEKNYSKINETLRYGLSYIVTLGVPCLIGLNTITVPIIYTVAGKNYLPAAISLHILTVALLFSFIGGFFGNLIMLPSGREKICLMINIISAVLNFGLNLIMIPRWGLNAAAFTTAVSNMVGMIISLRFVEKEIKIYRISEIIKAPLIGGIGILIISAVIRILVTNNYMITLLTILLSTVEYAWVLYILKNEFFMNFLESLKRKFIKNKN